MAINKLNDILDREEIQKLQDRFTQVTGVASVLTEVNGVPFTEFSGICPLCAAIRKTPQGSANCRNSNSKYHLYDYNDIEIFRCPATGLWEAGARIYVGEHHVGNWIIGQTRPDKINKKKIIKYASEIGIDKKWALNSLEEIKVMSNEEFRMILDILQLFTNQLSTLAYRKFLLKKEISEKKTLSEQLNYLTFHDPETGLINKDLCLERIRHLITVGKRTGSRDFSLIMISPKDLTHQTEIYGSKGANAIIRYVAEVLKQSVRTEDTVSRFSVDEFLLVLESYDNTEYSPEIVYKRILKSLETRLLLDDSLLKVRIDGGMVKWNVSNFEDVDQLVRKCYAALQESRKQESYHLFSYSDDMYESVMFEYELEKNFEEAIVNEEIIPYYQPIMKIALEGEPRIYGYEVLARWNHPQYGILMPSLFIPLAEKHNILGDLSKYLIRKASGFIREINRYHQDDPLFLSVNISPEEFIRMDFVGCIKNILKEENLPGEWVKLEITENSILKGGDESLEKIKELNSLGISLSIDDFGTGYSNLSLLCRLPLNNLKLDQSLIMMAEENESFIQAVISMANSLKMEIIAEGVEKESQIAILKKMGCFLHQGFFYAHPMDAETVHATQVGTGFSAMINPV